MHTSSFNPEDCPSDANELPEFAPLDVSEPKLAVTLRFAMIERNRSCIILTQCT